MRRTCSSSGAGVPSGRGLLGCGPAAVVAVVALTVAPPLTAEPLLTVAPPVVPAVAVVPLAGAGVFVALLPPPQAASSAPTALAAATRSNPRRLSAVRRSPDGPLVPDVV